MIAQLLCGPFSFVRCPATSLSMLLCPLLLMAVGGAAAQPSRVAYVTSEGAGAIAGVDIGSLQVVWRMDVGDRPHNLEMTADGLLVIATQGTDAVSIIDPMTDPVTARRIDIGMAPHDLAVSADGRTVLVVSEGGFFARLDPRSGRLLQQTPLQGRPHNITLRGQVAWVTDVSARRLFVVDGEKVQELQTSIVGHDLAVRPRSEELWVTPWNSDRTVVIDPGAQKEIAELRVGETSSHKHLAFTADGGEAWITEPESGSLFVVDAQTRSVVERIDLGGHPHHVRFDAARAYVAVGPNDLVVLDVGTRGVIGRVIVGSRVHDVVLPPAGED